MSDNLLERANNVFIPVFKRYPLEITHGKGNYLFDRNGKKYLDMATGLGVNALGYNHPFVISAIEEQLKRNLHLSNFFVQDVQIELMERLLEAFSPGGKGFFSNSGTESIEGALKLIKKWGPENGRHRILAMKSSFHGRTTGAVSITMQEKYQKPFQPLLPRMESLEFNSISSLEKTVSEDTAAVILEFVQGEGGVIPAAEDFVNELVRLREKFGFLIVADEIQTGIGRTGAIFAYQHYGMQPDIVCFAKAVGGGLPLGGFLVSASLANVFEKGQHGTTFGGNPLACAAGLAVMHYLNKENLAHINQMAYLLEEKLKSYVKRYEQIVDSRGLGLMQGLLIPSGVADIISSGFEKGIILNAAAGGKVLRFLPPLTITENELNEAFTLLDEIFNENFK